MTDQPCDRCNGTAIDPEHSGVENYGDGIVRPVPEPCNACQTPRHCYSCGHPCWGAYTVTLADARDAFGTSAAAFFSDIHQSALASALLTYRKQMNSLENTEPTA